MAVCVFFSFSGWDQSAEAKKSEAQRFCWLHLPGVCPQRMQHRGQVGNLQAHQRNKYASFYFLLNSVMKSCFIKPTFVLPQKFHALIFCFLTLTFMFLLWSYVFLFIVILISGARQARTLTSPNLLPCKLWLILSQRGFSQFILVVWMGRRSMVLLWHPNAARHTIQRTILLHVVQN